MQIREGARRAQLTTKVVSLDILLHHSIIAISIPLDGHGRPTLDQVELLACITLVNDIGAFDVRARFEDIGDLCAFLGLERGENLDFGEEVFVQPSLARCVLWVSV